MDNQTKNSIHINGEFTWLVTGAAGFIGSHIVENLLLKNQKVVGFDNLSTGKKQNLLEIKEKISRNLWSNFTFVEGDIRDSHLCIQIASGCDFVIHQAALGSVPLSIEKPDETNAINVNGFLNILNACRLNKSVRRLVFASSSSIYGNNPEMPLRENTSPCPLSPYAASKLINESYAQAFYHSYGLISVGLRYFNVYGERQDPNGSYAAVIPCWLEKLLSKDRAIVFGTGEQSRDFVYAGDVAEANVRAALSPSVHSYQSVNVGNGNSLNLRELFDIMLTQVESSGHIVTERTLAQKPARAGDVLHSVCDISKYSQMMENFIPTSFDLGMKALVTWAQTNREICRKLNSIGSTIKTTELT